MATIRKLVFTNNEYYHIFNRGIERRKTFLNKKEYDRAYELLSYYQYADIPLRYSHYSRLESDKKSKYLNLMLDSGKIIDIVAYCLMPNHFHLLIRQKKELGISTYVANFVNAYTKYFNTKHQRTGPLFQGIFKAVYVETEEQLLHLTRYIHLNPVASNIIQDNDLDKYPYSSLGAYLQNRDSDLIANTTITSIKALIPDYEFFVRDQIAYAKELDKIKHLSLE